MRRKHEIRFVYFWHPHPWGGGSKIRTRERWRYWIEITTVPIYILSEGALFNISKIYNKFKQHPINIYNKPYNTPPWHGACTWKILRKYSNASLSAKTKRDGQTDGRTDRWWELKRWELKNNEHTVKDELTVCKLCTWKRINSIKRYNEMYYEIHLHIKINYNTYAKHQKNSMYMYIIHVYTIGAVTQWYNYIIHVYTIGVRHTMIQFTSATCTYDSSISRKAWT